MNGVHRAGTPSTGGWQMLGSLAWKCQKCSLDLESGANSIKGKLGDPLTLKGDGPIVNEGLESLSVFILKHHYKLLPASVAVISFLSVGASR